MVTGSVAALLDVENANVCAGPIALKKPTYDIFFTNSFKMLGYNIKSMTSNPIKTVKEYQLSPLKISTTLPISFPAILLTTPANNANTKNGAACMTKSTIFKKTSLTLSTILKPGCAFSLGMKSKQIPKNTAKNMICNMSPLLDNEKKKLSGTISTKGCNGETFCCALAFSIFSDTDTSPNGVFDNLEISSTLSLKLGSFK